MADEPTPPGGGEELDWVVHCTRHGTRAHLKLEGLEKNPPDLKGCSLLPGQLPPRCSQACLGELTFSSPDSDEETRVG